MRTKLNTCSEEMILYMHEYMDGDISTEHEATLKKHLQSCQDCAKHFHELKKTSALIKSTSIITAPNDFASKVMARLPKEKRKVEVKRWFSRHPFLAAASLFIILMGGSIFSFWNNNQEFSFTKQPNLQVENHTVIVPEGETIKGDLIVKNGDLRIEGKVEGDVTVINGDQYMASAGNVTGDIKEINEMFDWLWYQIKNGGKEVISLFN
ncbi:anti-sigma factor [Heyndrickxia oleronia]|uniref:Anti-sigma-W factor RsiW n=1 Tax=Heyndrickxia oleronia TaxID=38875 RepID=A0AAW6SVV5_9BACI|nr:anti-sigma factor [Heyndrickxia oleronia]MDH5162954.1 anti-sigma factor [Heyndrickxia oleronia]